MDTDSQIVARALWYSTLSPKFRKEFAKMAYDLNKKAGEIDPNITIVDKLEPRVNFDGDGPIVWVLGSTRR